MSDATTTVSALREAMAKFVAERDWEKFHSPKNLVMGLAVETAELMEHFLWMDIDASRATAQAPDRREAIGEELADVTCYLLALANTMNIDLGDAVLRKLKKNALKYPAERYRGRYEAES